MANVGLPAEEWRLFPAGEGGCLPPGRNHGRRSRYGRTGAALGLHAKSLRVALISFGHAVQDVCCVTVADGVREPAASRGLFRQRAGLMLTDVDQHVDRAYKLAFASEDRSR